jgi:polysaccharide export outer membrane protein
LSIRVFQEPDLSFERLQVDAGGNINFPLVGTIHAAGKDPLALSEELEHSLSTRFIRAPQVVVGVAEAVGQRFVVEGSVIEPGTFQIAGRATLLESIARARGLTRVAQNDKVAIFREIDGQRSGALFNLNDIREGRAPDPEILGGDTVVVGFSAIKGAYRDFLATAPLFNLFRNF